LKFGLSIKRFGRYPAIEPRHLLGSRQERLGRGRSPPTEDLASDHTQQNDLQQTACDAKGGEESNSYNASFTLEFILPESVKRINAYFVKDRISIYYPRV
jgi:hypothetical protein